MKRTGIFALAGACALGVTALVGGVGYASALDVAEQAGATIDVPGVSTVDKTSEEVAKATTLDKNKSTPTPEPTDPATEPPVVETPVVDDGTDDVDEVDPSDPVVIPEDGTKDPDGLKGCGKGDDDGDWGDTPDDGVVDPAEGDGSWTGDKDWSDDRDGSWDDGQWTGDPAPVPAPAPAPVDPNTGDSWNDGHRDGGDRSDRGGGDRSDRGGDRGQRGGGHGHGGGGHHGGRG